MFPAIFEAEVLAFDLHKVIDFNPKFFEPLMNLLIRAEKKVHIVSGPSRIQVEKELLALNICSHYHYNVIHSVVDFLKSEGVKMWQDENKRWWSSEKDWWGSKGKICRLIGADIMLDDKVEFEVGFPDDHPTQFILFDQFKSMHTIRKKHKE